MSSTTVIIDCYGFFYRAYYAFRNNPLTNSKGQETAVLYSFFTTLHKIITDRHHTHLICVLDSKGKTFRHNLYAEYKAHRPPMPDGLSQQIAAIVKILGFFGIPTVNVVGLEADDIIAYYTQFLTKNYQDMEIFSYDKDLMQLVSKQIRILHIDRQKGYVVFDEEAVKKKYGITPQQIVDYLSLVGDNSDNIPGVKGIGDKTAVKLIQEYGSIEKIYKVLGDIPPRYEKNLRKGYKQALLSKSLVDLQNHLERIDQAMLKKIPRLETLKYQTVNINKIKELWQEYECLSLIKKYRINSINQKNSLSTYNLIRGESSTMLPEEPVKNYLSQFVRKDLPLDKWEECIRAICKHKSMIFDLETTSLIPFDSSIVSAIVVLPNCDSYYFSIIGEKKNGEKYDYQVKWVGEFKEILQDEKIAKIGHNLKFEYTILKHHGIDLAGITHDTMIYEYIVDPDRNAFKLSDLVKKYFQVEKPVYSEIAKGFEKITDIPAEILQKYTYEDGEYTFLIYQEQLKRHQLNSEEEKLYQKLELPLLKVLGKMELSGVLINKNHLENIEKILTLSLGELEKEIYRLADEKFNINSTKELQRVLFEKLRINPIKKTKTGLSTDSYVLEKLSRLYPIANSLVQYRKTTKLLNTYVKTLPTLVHPYTGRIHTHYNQSVAATGRLSSNKPNLQNIPVNNDAQGIRYAFIAPPSYQLVKIDYSQVELRIVAYLSQDPQLLKAYENDQDIHTLTAHLIFGKPLTEITPEERSMAKTINFSVIYGISAFSLSEDLGVSRENAKFFIDSYFQNYAGVKNYQNQILEKARQEGCVKTYYGRNRYVREIGSHNFISRSRSERIAFNTIIQGTASDIIKKAMVNISSVIEKKYPSVEMVMQVHDELVFYIPEEMTKEVVLVLEKELINVKPFNKILSVNTKVSKHWE